MGASRAFAIGAGLLLACPVLAHKTPTLEYADHLFRWGEYYRAISEYSRNLYYDAATKEDSSYCVLQMARAYYLGERYDECIAFIRSLPADSEVAAAIRTQLDKYTGLSYLRMGFPELSAPYLRRNADQPEMALLTGVSYLYASDWERALEQFRELSASDHRSVSLASEELAAVAREAKALKRKSPLIAGILSVVPGVGYLYTGYYQTALSSFVLNGLLLGSGYELHRKGLPFTGDSVLAIGLGWYIGNIYGSVMSAHRHNRAKETELVEESTREVLHSRE